MIQDHPYHTTAFSLVLWLLAKGFTPLRATLTRDGTARILYHFSPAARDEVERYYEAKEQLNLLALGARNDAINPRQSNTYRAGAFNAHLDQR